MEKTASGAKAHSFSVPVSVGLKPHSPPAEAGGLILKNNAGCLILKDSGLKRGHLA